MEYIYRIYERMDDDVLLKFLDFVNDTEETDKVKVFISTVGGQLDVANAIINICNSDKVTEVLFEQTLSSAALYMFARIAPTKVKYTEEMESVQHLVSSSLQSRPSSYAKSKKKATDIINNLRAEVIRYVISDEEYEEYLKGEDIVITTPQILAYRDIVIRQHTEKELEDKRKKVLKIVENGNHCICQVKSIYSVCPCKLEECICGLYDKSYERNQIEEDTEVSEDQ